MLPHSKMEFMYKQKLVLGYRVVKMIGIFSDFIPFAITNTQINPSAKYTMMHNSRNLWDKNL